MSPERSRPAPATERVRIPVVVSPRSASNSIGPIIGGAVRVRVTAAPADGAANAALLRVLASALGTGVGAVSIATGATRRRKVVIVEGMSTAHLAERIPGLAALLGEIKPRREDPPGARRR
jgi:uncharacterized protein YggU (UPF0235/DUF167 family)